MITWGAVGPGMILIALIAYLSRMHVSLCFMSGAIQAGGQV